MRRAPCILHEIENLTKYSSASLDFLRILNIPKNSCLIIRLFGKIFEKIMYTRIYNFLISNNLMYSKQFGFRKGHSTSHALNFSIAHLANKKHCIGACSNSRGHFQFAHFHCHLAFLEYFCYYLHYGSVILTHDCYWYAGHNCEKIKLKCYKFKDISRNQGFEFILE